jgi:hypothetical protein
MSSRRPVCPSLSRRRRNSITLRPSSFSFSLLAGGECQPSSDQSPRLLAQAPSVDSAPVRRGKTTVVSSNGRPKARQGEGGHPVELRGRGFMGGNIRCNAQWPRRNSVPLLAAPSAHCHGGSSGKENGTV